MSNPQEPGSPDPNQPPEPTPPPAYGQPEPPSPYSAPPPPPPDPGQPPQYQPPQYGAPPSYGQPPQYGQPPPQYGQPPPQYGAPPPYGQPQYGSGYPMSVGTNGFAIASLICAFFCSPLGIIFGFVAKSQIKQTGQGGDGLATAGIIISIVFIVIPVIILIAGISTSSSG